MVYREYNLILKILKGMLVVCKNLQQYISPLQPDIGPMSTGRGYNPGYMHLLSRSLVAISFYGLKFRITTQWTHTDHGCSQSYHGSSQLYHGHPMAHHDCGVAAGSVTVLVMYSQISEGKPCNTTKF